MLGTLGARIAALVDGDDRRVRARRLASFEQGFALIVGVEYWLRALPRWDALALRYFLVLAVATPACLAIVVPWTRFARRGAFALLATAHAVLVWSEFPSTGNHAYLELLVCLLAAFLSPDDDGEALLYLRALRWLVVIVLFWSGIQKLVSGYWLGGEYLAFALGSETYRSVLAWLVSPGELARLSALRGEVGDGPYRAAGPGLVLASNVAWCAEVLLAPALCWRRTRPLALVGALVLISIIEVAAREFFFGLVFALALLNFARRDVMTPARWAIAVLLGWLALSALLWWGERRLRAQMRA